MTVDNCDFCGGRVRIAASFDTGSGESHFGHKVAWNLFQCESCGAVARQNVWDFKGVVWIGADDTIRVAWDERDAPKPSPTPEEPT